MRELPIIFNTEMIRAILIGDKVCTRRPFTKTNHKYLDCAVRLGEVGDFISRGFIVENDDLPYILDLAPYQTGDLLYVRETWCRLVDEGFAVDENIVKYKADGEIIFYNIGGKSGKITPKWKPSIHMPKKYARIWLKVTGVRVERVQDISDNDCLREGIEIISSEPDQYYCRDYSRKRSIEHWTFFEENEKESFKTLWDSLYNNWDSNPWVWVIDFEVIKK